MAPIYDLLPKINRTLGRTEGVYTTIDNVASGDPGLFNVTVADASNLPEGGSDGPCELCVVDAANPLNVKEVFSNWTGISGNVLQNCARRYGQTVAAGDIAHVGPTGSAYNLLCDSVKALGGVARIVSKTPGHYATFAEAIDAIAADGEAGVNDVIVAFPGVYLERLTNLRNSVVCMGNVTAQGIDFADPSVTTGFDVMIDNLELSTSLGGGAEDYAITTTTADQYACQIRLRRCLISGGGGAIESAILHRGGFLAIDSECGVANGAPSPAGPSMAIRLDGSVGYPHLLLRGGHIIVNQSSDAGEDAAAIVAFGAGAVVDVESAQFSAIIDGATEFGARVAGVLCGDGAASSVRDVRLRVRTTGGATFGADSYASGIIAEEAAEIPNFDGLTVEIDEGVTLADVREATIEADNEEISSIAAKLPAVVRRPVHILLSGDKDTPNLHLGDAAFATACLGLGKIVLEPAGVACSGILAVVEAGAAWFTALKNDLPGTAPNEWDGAKLFVAYDPYSAGDILIVTSGAISADPDGTPNEAGTCWKFGVSPDFTGGALNPPTSDSRVLLSACGLVDGQTRIVAGVVEIGAINVFDTSIVVEPGAELRPRDDMSLCYPSGAAPAAIRLRGVLRVAGRWHMIGLNGIGILHEGGEFVTEIDDDYECNFTAIALGAFACSTFFVGGSAFFINITCSFCGEASGQPAFDFSGLRGGLRTSVLIGAGDQVVVRVRDNAAVDFTGVYDLTAEPAVPIVPTLLNGGVMIPSISVQSLASAATITPLAANDVVSVSALAEAATIAAPSGTAEDGHKLVIRIKDNGTARALTWNAAYVLAISGVALPVATTAGKWHHVNCIYNATASEWQVVAIEVEP
ncbi:MAG: hypothetical protein C4523_17750 [Myxococcales bacterium]|nr:MAG: hypothetical protein C4523_17750 [Myxococcales bacterium]